VFAVPNVGLERLFPDWLWWPHLGQAAKFITPLWLSLVRIKMLQSRLMRSGVVPVQIAIEQGETKKDFTMKP